VNIFFVDWRWPNFQK